MPCWLLRFDFKPLRTFVSLHPCVIKYHCGEFVFATDCFEVKVYFTWTNISSGVICDPWTQFCTKKGTLSTSEQNGCLLLVLPMNHCLLTVVSPHNSPLVSWCQRGWSAGSHRARCDPDYGSSSGAPMRHLWSGGSCPARSPPDGREHRGRCRGVWCHHRWSAHSETGSTVTQ